MRKKLDSLFSPSKTKGFTLIELLVVIGILGILAVAVLAAINPIEQLNKAQDSSLENAATTYESAVVQYYTVHNDVPWDVIANGGTACHAGPGFNSVNLGTALGACTTKLIAENELKASFANTPNLNKLFVSTLAPVGGTYTTYVCFQPVSKQVQADPQTKYSKDGQAAGNYWCAQ
jgi:prepilin-type N-terminal cleavage/methylation domain-containing protein